MLRALVISCALLACACDGALLTSEGFVQPDYSGSLRLPLTAVDPDGTRYELHGLTVEISGAALLTLSTTARTEPALSTPLPPGRYTLFVRPGFRVTKVGAQGRHPIDARLASPNPLHFTIDRVQAATAKLSFAHPGGRITFGAPRELRITRAP